MRERAGLLLSLTNFRARAHVPVRVDLREAGEVVAAVVGNLLHLGVLEGKEEGETY